MRWLPMLAVAAVIGLACGQAVESSPQDDVLTPQVVQEIPFAAPTSTPLPFPLDRPLTSDEALDLSNALVMPPGSDYTALQAAAVVYSTMLFDDLDFFREERVRLDPEIGALNQLRQEGTISEEQSARRRDILARLESIDNFMILIEQDLSLVAALNRVVGYLEKGMWAIEYRGDGLWHIDSGTGPWFFDETTNEVNPRTEGSSVG